MNNIVMIGVQGSGKGTQAQLLSSRLGLPVISPGKLFRTEIEKQTNLGKDIESYIDSGDLVPADIVDQMISERVLEEDAQRGFILDGFPRSIVQAEALEKIMEKVGNKLTDAIYINISDEEAIRRLSGRRVCSNQKCEAVYHIDFHPPKNEENKCDRCGSELMQREDDTPEAIEHRLKLYHSETSPLIDFYKSKGILREINGDQNINDVENDIVNVLGV